MEHATLSSPPLTKISNSINFARYHRRNVGSIGGLKLAGWANFLSLVPGFNLASGLLTTAIFLKT